MSLKQPLGASTFENIPAGTYVGILFSIIDLGSHQVMTKDGEKIRPKIRFTWELPGKTKEINGVAKPLIISGEYTNSMYQNSRMRPVIEGLLGAKLRDDEAANFDIEAFSSLLGTAILISIVESEDGKYTNVATVAPMVSGMPKPKQFNENVLFEIGTSSEEDFMRLPEFIRKKILASEEYAPKGESKAPAETGMSETEKAIVELARKKHNESVENWSKNEEGINPSDIPF